MLRANRESGVSRVDWDGEEEVERRARRQEGEAEGERRAGKG